MDSACSFGIVLVEPKFSILSPMLGSNLKFCSALFVWFSVLGYLWSLWARDLGSIYMQNLGFLISRIFHIFQLL